MSSPCYIARVHTAANIKYDIEFRLFPLFRPLSEKTEEKRKENVFFFPSVSSFFLAAAASSLQGLMYSIGVREAVTKLFTSQIL